MRNETVGVWEALGLRALACKHWRWMPGMLGLSMQSSSRSIWIRVVDPPNDDTTECWPDFTDPATLGCLLALVREAHNAPAAYLMGSVSKKWVVHHFAEPEGYWKPLTKWQPTEAEALVAALEAAQ